MFPQKNPAAPASKSYTQRVEDLKSIAKQIVIADQKDPANETKKTIQTQLIDLRNQSDIIQLTKRDLERDADTQKLPSREDLINLYKFRDDLENTRNTLEELLTSLSTKQSKSLLDKLSEVYPGEKSKSKPARVVRR